MERLHPRFGRNDSAQLSEITVRVRRNLRPRSLEGWAPDVGRDPIFPELPGLFGDATRVRQKSLLIA